MIHLVWQTELTNLPRSPTGGSRTAPGQCPLERQHGPCLLSQALNLKCPFGTRAEVGSVQDVSVLVLTTACGC